MEGAFKYGACSAGILHGEVGDSKEFEGWKIAGTGAERRFQIRDAVTPFLQAKVALPNDPEHAEVVSG